MAYSAITTKYTRMLEERWDNENTGEVWTIDDVPKLWRNKVKSKVLDDGYYFLDDGTVMKKDETE